MSEIDSLEVKIEASAKGVDTQIDKLISKLQEIGKTLNNVDTGALESVATIIKGLSSVMQDTSKSTAKMTNSFKGMDNVSSVTKKAEESLQGLVKTTKDFSNINIDHIAVPEGYVNQEKEIKRLKKSLESYISTQNRYKKLGVSEDSTQWQNNLYHIEETKALIQRLTDLTNEYKASMEKPVEFATPKISITELLEQELEYGATKVFENWGVTVNDVIKGIETSAGALQLKMMDFKNLNISEEFEDMEIDDDMSPELQGLIERYGKLKEKLLELESVFNQVAEASSNFTNDSNSPQTPFYLGSQSIASIQQTISAMNELRDKITETEMCGEGLSNSFKTEIANDSLEELERKVNSITNEYLNAMKILGDNNTNMPIGDVSDLDDAMQSYRNYNQLLPILKARIEELKKANEDAMSNMANTTGKSTVSMKNALDLAKKSIESLKNTKIGSTVAGIGTTLKGVGQGIGGATSTAIKGLIVGIKGASNVAKSLSTGLKSVSKYAYLSSVPLKSMFKISTAPIVNGFKKLKSVFSGLGDQIKRVTKMYSLMIIRMALRKVIDNAKNSLNDLTRQNASVNNSVSSLVTNFKWLGASITGAFSPIFGVIAPILDAIVEKCVSVVNTIGQVFASLTGADTYTYAKKVQVDYASSLDDAKDSANKATKAVKEYENQLMGFDEINKLTAPTDSGSNGTSGSGSSANADGYEYVFDTASIESQYNNWADKLKEAWNKGDFTEIGVIVGKKLTDALENIPWDSIKETCSKVARSVATFLNGFMQGADFTVIGDTLAQAINTAFETMYTFVSTFDFDKFGQKVADLLNGAFSTIDWTLIANTLSESTNNVFSAIFNFADNFNWSENTKSVMDGFKTYVDEIKWDDIKKSFAEVGKGLGEAINEIFYIDNKTSLGSDLSEIIWESCNSVIETVNKFISTTEWGKIGGNIIKLLTDSIGDIDWSKVASTISSAITGIFDFLIGAVENLDLSQLRINIFSAIGDLILGINWGSIITNMIKLLGESVIAVKDGFVGMFTDVGPFLIEGLKNGIVAGIKGIGKWFLDYIRVILDVTKEFFGIHSPSTVFAELGGFLIAGLKLGISNAISSIGKWLNDNVVTPITNKVSKITGSFTIKGVKDKTFDTVKNAWNGIKATTKNLSLKAKATGQTVIDKFKKAWDSLKSKSITLGLKVNELVGDVKGFINKQLIDKINSKLPKVFPKIPQLATGGMVNAGQLFIAREAGPEMVGTMGGRTTVANNDQIVAGISSGVYNAVVSAMAHVGGNSGNVNVVLQGDAKGLFKVVQAEGKNYQLTTGLPAF